MKDLRELGSKRRETVWSLSVAIQTMQNGRLVRKDRRLKASDRVAVEQGEPPRYAFRG